MGKSSSSFLERTLELGTSLVRCLPPEPAHSVGLGLLRLPLWNLLPPPLASLSDLDMSMEVPGVGPLRHPVGLAAGFDKDCEAPGGFRSVGFSFLEVGTVTPKPQPGNPGPRLFRLPGGRGLVNRMGFNNRGVAELQARLRELRWEHGACPLAVNIGKNRTTPEERAIDDYASAAQAVADLASFLVANISSPNTPGLRNLASREFVTNLAASLPHEVRRKTWVKLDPDLSRPAFREVVAAVAQAGFAGLVLTNTHRVEKPEAGGMSGHALLTASTARLEWAWEVHRGSLPMIGVGGIFTGLDVLEKVMRGACAVEIYTSFIYRGPMAVHAILRELGHEMRLRGIRSLREVQGTHYEGMRD